MQQILDFGRIICLIWYTKEFILDINKDSLQKPSWVHQSSECMRCLRFFSGHLGKKVLYNICIILLSRHMLYLPTYIPNTKDIQTGRYKDIISKDFGIRPSSYDNNTDQRNRRRSGRNRERTFYMHADILSTNLRLQMLYKCTSFITKITTPTSVVSSFHNTICCWWWIFASL